MAQKPKTKTNGGSKAEAKRPLRSRLWFDNPDNPGMTALYLERYMNYGLTREELQVGQADHRHRADRLRPLALQPPPPRARRSACAKASARRAASPFEFPVHPIQETGKRPTAALDRNLAYLGLVEILYGYPIDGVVLTTGCDKTTPACIMAAATVNIPAIVLSGGPMLNGWFHGERTGSGTIVWKARQRPRRGRDRLRAVHRARRLLGALGRPLQHHGHGLDDELAGRGARHEPARLRRDPRAAPRARPDRLRDRQAHRRDGVGGPEALRDHDARGVRERHRRQLARSAARPTRRSTSTPSPAISA